MKRRKVPPRDLAKARRQENGRRKLRRHDARKRHAELFKRRHEIVRRLAACHESDRFHRAPLRRPRAHAVVKDDVRSVKLRLLSRLQKRYGVALLFLHVGQREKADVRLFHRRHDSAAAVVRRKGLQGGDGARDALRQVGGVGARRIRRKAHALKVGIAHREVVRAREHDALGVAGEADHGARVAGQ